MIITAKKTRLFRSKILFATAVLCVSVLTISPLLAAEQNTTHPADAVRQDESHAYSIASGTLSDALLQFSEQSGGLQLVSPAELTEGKVTPGLSGRYSPREALSRILAGSGLGYRFYNATSFTLFKSGEQTNVLGAVRVDGVGSEVVGGINGSTDVTATEGSGSYAGQTMSIGSKTPQSIKETPQSVSMVTSAQMKDARVTNLKGAMDSLAGVSVSQGNRSDQVKFYSRAREISRIQIDGGAPLEVNSNSRYSPVFDMSLYDHVELLRGADGLFNGNGEAGGVVNLVRKRPLDHNQITVESSAASWDNYRNSVDVAGPLAFDGALRGRAVATWEKRRFFYDGANDEKKVVFASLEADVTPDTQWRIGASYTDQKGRPWTAGLKSYKTGEDLRLPRNFSIVMPWEFSNTKNTEWFTQLDHRFSDNWSTNLNFTQSYNREDGLGASIYGVVDQNGDGSAMEASAMRSKSRQLALDGTLNGEFDLWGLPQKLVVGGNYKRLNGSGDGPAQFYTYLDDEGNERNFNIFRFRDTDWSEPDFSGVGSLNSRYSEHQAGGYVAVTITPWKPLHFMTGVRYNQYKNENDQDGLLPQKMNETEFQLPYYAVSYDLAHNWSIYASYTDIYQSQAYMKTKEGRSLDPLTGSNKEVGIKYGDDKRNIALSAYSLTQKGGASTTSIDPGAWLIGDQACCYRNNNSVEISDGFDLEVNGEMLADWQLSFSYTYSRNKYKGEDSGQVGQPIRSQFPKQILKLASSYQLSGNPYLDRLKIGGTLKAQTKNYAVGSSCQYDDPDCVNEVPFKFTQGFYAVTSAFVSYQISSYWDVAFNVNNLFDRHYYETIGDARGGSWYGEPRNYALTLYGTF